MPSHGKFVTEDTLLRIADAVPALVALYDIKTAEYLYVNRAVKKLLGYTEQQFIEGGLAFAVGIVHPDDIQRLLAENQAVLEKANAQAEDTDEPIASFQYRMKRADGVYRWFVTEGTVFGRADDGTVQFILNVSFDVTVQKRTESALKRSLTALEKTLKADD
ncbi:MAG: domain S-box protein [Candidatus Saccharibacteria bacterium]|jgi:PAS domain S-box-containing protein|nr:domain S-box protein [Candidatus Saccharibacteria bacterium]